MDDYSNGEENEVRFDEDYHRKLRDRRQEMVGLVGLVQSGGCPAPAKIIALHRKKLPMDEYQLIENHVVFCDRCAREFLVLDKFVKDKLGE